MLFCVWHLFTPWFLGWKTYSYWGLSDSSDSRVKKTLLSKTIKSNTVALWICKPQPCVVNQLSLEWRKSEIVLWRHVAHLKHAWCSNETICGSSEWIRPHLLPVEVCDIHWLTSAVLFCTSLLNWLVTGHWEGGHMAMKAMPLLRNHRLGHSKDSS